MKKQWYPIIVGSLLALLGVLIATNQSHGASPTPDPWATAYPSWAKSPIPLNAFQAGGQIPAVCVSGLWPQPDENGLTNICDKVGYPFVTHWDLDLVSQVKDRFKIAAPSRIDLICHSFGCQTVVDAIPGLQKAGYTVHLVVMLDPVHSNWLYWPPSWWQGFDIPITVGSALCIKKSWGFPPSVGFANDNWLTHVITTSEHARFPALPAVTSGVVNAVLAARLK